MRSPFAIIRKHQKVMMVITIGLCMFAFIFLGAIEQSGGQGMLPIVGLMMGAGVFWIIGNQAGKPRRYTVVGAMLGVLLGLWLPRLSNSSAEVWTTVGDFSPQEVQQLITNRQNANRFMASAYAATHKTDNPNLQQFAAQFLNQGIFGTQFHLISADPKNLPEDVIFGFLLRHEAEEMGITVSDASVIKHIKDATTPAGFIFEKRGELSGSEFKEIRSNLGLSETELFDILRSEIQAQIARRMLAPQTLRIPEQSWQDYRKVNVKQSLEVTALNVEAFADEVVPLPLDDSELEAFFERHKANFPGQTSLGAPGFFQPRKVQLAFLEADYETIEAKVPDITDDEIADYYQENKDRFYRIDRLPEFLDAPESPTSESDSPKTEGPKLLDPNDGDDKKKETDEGNTKQDSPAKDTDSKKEESGKSADTPKTDAPPKSDSDSSKKAKPEEQPKLPKGDKPASGKKENGDDDAQAAAADSGQLLALADLPSDAVPLASTILAADDDDGKNAKNKDTESENPKTEKPESEAKQAADSKVKSDESDVPKSDVKSKAEESTSDDEKKTDPKSESKVAPPFPELPDSGDPPAPHLPQPKIPTPTYRPLGDVRDDIRDNLLREKTSELLKKKTKQARDEMGELGFFINALEGDADKLSPEAAAKRLKEYAKKNGLRYVTTKLLSYADLQSEDYPIGNSVEPVDNPFDTRVSATVSDQIFRSESLQLYASEISHDRFGTDNRFVWWVINDKKEHEPTFDEAGVSEQVLEQWKTFHGRPKAEERAKELAKRIRDAQEEKKNMSDALADQTVTGREDALPLSVLATPLFSWHTPTSPSIPRLNPLQQPNESSIRLSTIPGIEKVGNRFMESVYKLSVDDVDVIPNKDLSAYYVVRLMERDPGNDAMKRALQTKFLNGNGFSSPPNRELASISRRLAFGDWYQDFQQKYDIRWNSKYDN